MAAVFMAHRVRLAVNSLVLLGAFFCSCTTGDATGKIEKKWFDESRLYLQNVNGTYLHHNTPFTGNVYVLAANKKDTVAVASFLNGKEDGAWRKYFTNGQLMEQRFYTAGMKTGIYKGWWPNGKQRLLYHFANGEYEGPCKDWSENGQLVSEMNYSQGYENGSQKLYYENGKLKANYIIQDGRRYGLLGTKNCVNVTDSVFK